jgi:hypothetical protein
VTTFWISFEDRATEAWAGTLIVDREDFLMEDESVTEWLAQLTVAGLAPKGKFTVDLQRLPPIANIPSSHKNRLITNAAETAAVGGVMRSRHGAN